MRRILLTAAAVMVASGIITSGAFAKTGHVQVAATQATASSVPMGFCGPSFSSKAAMINWYQSHPAQMARAEVYVRLNAGYYHIQPDQSFIAWLSMPNVKYKVAPAGYMLQHNTRCDSVGNVVPFDHKLDASKLPMLWWCLDASGSGSGCTPIAKFYCRNFVKGPKAFPKPQTPVTPKKPATPTKPTPTPKEICSSDLKGNWDEDTQTCVIQQGNCSQAIIIIGNNNYVNGGTINCTTNTPPPPSQPPPPPPAPPVVTPPPSVRILSCDTLNMVPAGQPSGMLHCMVFASTAGSFTIDGGIGSVSDCNGGARQGSVSTSLSAGNNTVCFIAYAPNDADQPANFTLTFTAIVSTSGGTAQDQKVQGPAIQYPSRGG